jgi:hypothetical protein
MGGRGARETPFFFALVRLDRQVALSKKFLTWYLAAVFLHY